MQHHFDIEIAKIYGVELAIFLDNIAYWTLLNKANKKHFRNGRYWTYNSQEAFTVLFPYWTRQNIRTILKKCIENDLIIQGNYNATSYDRTTWYALTDKGLSMFSKLTNGDTIGYNQPMEKLDQPNPLVSTNQPIPDNNTDIKPDAFKSSCEKLKKSTKQKPKSKSKSAWQKNNEVRHDFADKMDIKAESQLQMKNETKSIKENEQFKDNLKNTSSLKVIEKHMDIIRKTLGRNTHGRVSTPEKERFGTLGRHDTIISHSGERICVTT